MDDTNTKTTTYSILKSCNNCHDLNKEDANSCRFCGLLFIKKNNSDSRVYRSFEIKNKQKPKKKLSNSTTLDEIERFGIKHDFG